MVHILSHTGLHSTVTALENGLPKNKVKNLKTYRDAHKKHTWTLLNLQRSKSEKNN